MAELRCEGLVKRYGERLVLHGVDLHVAQGTLTAILGASGSGKTTLLRVVMGLVRADAGRVLVGGSLVADGARVDVPPDKRSVGYVAQEGALFPHLTVGENVGFGLPRSQRKRGTRVGEMLELVGLGGGYRDRRPHELSGGEQRRVALARALAPRPRLVLLDEPFSGLDAALRADTRSAVLHALVQEGATAVLVTHDQAEALSMGHEVAVLRDGRLVQRGAPAALYRAPIDVQLAQFLGEAVVLPGTADGGKVSCALGELEAQHVADSLRGAVDVMVRPEQIRVHRRQADREPSARGVPATVVGHAYYGPYTVIRLTLQDASQTRAALHDANQTAAALHAADGTAVWASSHDRDLPGVGEAVELSVCGPVMAYPARGDQPRPGAVEGESLQLAQAAG